MVEAAGKSEALTAAVMIDGTLSTSWENNGWALIPAFLDSTELTAMQIEAGRLIDDPAPFRTRGAVPNSAARSDRLDPVIDLSPAFASLASDPRLLAIVGAALGGEAQLMKDKFIAKPPGAPGYATHQDGGYWPGMGLNPSRFLTAVIFLDDATAEKGPIECASGHHKSLLTDPDCIADPDENELGPFTSAEARAGDLLLLHALTPHRSGPNRSGEMRRALLFTFGLDDRPDLYELYYRQQRSARS